MASDHMMPSSAAALVQQWAVKSAAWPDNCISDFFLRDTDVVTRALQKSLSSPSPSTSVLIATPSSTSTANHPPSSSTSGASSEPDSPAPTPPLSARHSTVKLTPAAGRVAKRKSRAAKRSPTTYINADPANFRQMVQQVTGIRGLPSTATASAAVLKPEPQRLAGAGAGRAVAVPQQCMLPTLDTSAFLLGHHQQQAMAPPMSFGSGDGGFSADLDAFTSFPTLESWRVM